MSKSSIHSNSSLQRQEGLLSWLQEFAPYGILILDQTFRVQGWNHWLEMHSGLKLEDVCDKCIFELYPDIEPRRLRGHFERALAGEASVLSTALHRYLLPLPSQFRESAPEQMLQTARVAPLLHGDEVRGVVAVIEDVTQRECQAAALASQHRRDELLSWTLAQLLQTDQPRKMVRQIFFKLAEQLDLDTFLVYLRHAPGQGLVLDAAGGVPEAAGVDLTSFPFEKLVSKNLGETLVLNSVNRKSGPEYDAMKRASMSAAVVAPLLSNERNLGYLCFATWTRETIQPEEAALISTISQYLATSLDRETTKQQLQKTKEQLADHAALLEQKVQERTSSLQETVNELETFSYTIAHDLRAPARVTTGYGQVLLEDFSESLPADAKLILEKIVQTSKRMEVLTHDLLQFNKVSRQEIVLSAVNLEDVIDELLEIQLPKAKAAVAIERPLHKVCGHAGMLGHALSNLLDNAHKFVHPNTSPNIRIFTEVVPKGAPNPTQPSLIFSSAAHLATVRSSETAGTERVRIWVCDSGIGIAPEAQRKIFSIFERAVSGEAYQGTGIGLAIVVRAMQRMGGTCGVESRMGEGSCFYLELPSA